MPEARQVRLIDLQKQAMTIRKQLDCERWRLPRPDRPDADGLEVPSEEQIHRVLEKLLELYEVPDQKRSGGSVQLLCYRSSGNGQPPLIKSKESHTIKRHVYRTAGRNKRTDERRQAMKELCNREFEKGFLLTAYDLAQVFDCSVRTCTNDLKWFAMNRETIPFYGSIKGRSVLR